MGLQRMTLESQNAMNAVDGATIERRIRIIRPDEGRGRCKGSRVWDPRKDFSQRLKIFRFTAGFGGLAGFHRVESSNGI
jgi:hypothetical protein